MPTSNDGGQKKEKKRQCQKMPPNFHILRCCESPCRSQMATALVCFFPSYQECLWMSVYMNLYVQNVLVIISQTITYTRLNISLWTCRRSQEFVKEVESTAETENRKRWRCRTLNQRSVCNAGVFTVHCTHGALNTVIRATGGKSCCSPDCRFQSPRPVIYMQIDSVMWASCYY